MKIGDTEIQQCTVDSVTAQILQQDWLFKFSDVQMWARVAGVPRGPDDRFADRLLQTLRRAGRIKFDGKCWRVVRQAAA